MWMTSLQLRVGSLVDPAVRAALRRREVAWERCLAPLTARSSSYSRGHNQAEEDSEPTASSPPSLHGFGIRTPAEPAGFRTQVSHPAAVSAACLVRTYATWRRATFS